MSPLENFYITLEEPLQSVFLYYRKFILESDENFTEHWKYKTPFFYYKGKWFCYLSFSKKTNRAYLGFVKGSKMEHSLLKSEGRKMIKIMEIDQNQDIPMALFEEILTLAKKLYA